MMLKKRDLQRIESKKREWDKALCGPERVIKKEIKHMMEFMMYYKKPKDKFERVWHTFEWWGIIIVIFFALKGFFG